MCTSSSNSELNKLLTCGDEEARTLIVDFGPYMNWGRWNHNTSRIQELIDHLISGGFNVQLNHTDEETTWEDHGFVKILAPTEDGENIELAYSPMVQHNKNYSKRKEELIQMGTSAMEKGKAV